MKKALRILLILSIQLVLVLAALEIGLRLAFQDYVLPAGDSPKIWQYHATYGWIGRPSIDTRFRQPSFDIRVTHNSLGQRDKEYPSQRSDKKRLLVFGDSFVWGYGVEQDENFVEQLEKHHPEWEIINCGIAGTGTDQQYLYLQDMITHYQPDVVMLLVIQNDFQDNMTRENHNYYKPFFTVENGKLVLHQVPVPKPRLDQTIERLVYGRSYLYNASKFLMQVMESKWYAWRGKEMPRWNPYAGFDFPASNPVMIALLNGMIDITEQHHARFVLVHGQIIDPLQMLLRGVAQQRGIPLHNLDRAFEGHVHAEYQIPGDAHWNALGHGWVANDIDLFLREQGIFTATTSSGATP